MSWRDRRLAALCQAGLVEKFVDALVWVFWPVYPASAGREPAGHRLDRRRLRLHLGRRRSSSPADSPTMSAGIWPNVLGHVDLRRRRRADAAGRRRALVGASAAQSPGFGMALLYPNLSAAVADIAQPAWRASAIGIYRFWRDLGYGIGALGLGCGALRWARLDAVPSGSFPPRWCCLARCCSAGVRRRIRD